MLLLKHLRKWSTETNSTSPVSIPSDVHIFFQHNVRHRSSHHIFVKPSFPAEGKMLLRYLLFTLFKGHQEDGEMLVLKVTAPNQERGPWHTAQLPCLGSGGEKNINDRDKKS